MSNINGLLKSKFFIVEGNTFDGEASLYEVEGTIIDAIAALKQLVPALVREQKGSIEEISFDALEATVEYNNGDIRKWRIIGSNNVTNVFEVDGVLNSCNGRYVPDKDYTTPTEIELLLLKEVS